MRKLRIVFFITITAFMCACGNTSKTDMILDMAESVAVDHPDSAQTMLETLYPYSSMNRVQKARCGVLLASAKLQQNKSFASDNLLDNSIAYYMQNNDSVELFKAFQLKAYQSMWRGRQDSMSYYLQQSILMISADNNTQLYSLEFT